MRLGEGPAGFQIASCQAVGAVEEPIVNGPVTAPASRRAITSRRWCAKHWLRSCGRQGRARTDPMAKPFGAKGLAGSLRCKGVEMVFDWPSRRRIRWLPRRSGAAWG